MALAVPMTGFFGLPAGGFTAAMRPVGLLGRDLTTVDQVSVGAGLNDGLFSETMDFRDFPSVLSAVRIAQS